MRPSCSNLGTGVQTRLLFVPQAPPRPVAATDVFGSGEHIVDGETGYLCEPDDLDALTSLLDRVLGAGPEEWRRIAAAGERQIRRLDVDRWIDGWAELLHSAVEAP